MRDPLLLPLRVDQFRGLCEHIPTAQLLAIESGVLKASLQRVEENAQIPCLIDVLYLQQYCWYRDGSMANLLAQAVDFIFWEICSCRIDFLCQAHCLLPNPQITKG